MNRSAKTGVILLAAGNSTRMGSPKQLLDYGGKPLLRHAVEVALKTECQHVIVVLGANAGEVRSAIDDLPVTIAENPLWFSGMGTSIQAGIRRAQALGLDGAMLALADQPLVTTAMLDGLLANHQSSGKSIVASEYGGSVGVPAFFAREYFPHLLALEAGQGCKGVILKHAAQALYIACPEAEADIDTPRDYQALSS